MRTICSSCHQGSGQQTAEARVGVSKHNRTSRQAGQHCSKDVVIGQSDAAACPACTVSCACSTGPCACTPRDGCKAAAQSTHRRFQQSSQLFHRWAQKATAAAATMLLLTVLLTLATGWAPGTAQTMLRNLTNLDINRIMIRISILKWQPSLDGSSHDKNQVATSHRQYPRPLYSDRQAGIAGMTRHSVANSLFGRSGSTGAAQEVALHRHLLQVQTTPLPSQQQQQQQFRKSFAVLQQHTGQLQQPNNLLLQQQFSEGLATASAWLGAATVRTIQPAIAASAPASRLNTMPTSPLQYQMPYVVQAAPAQAVYATKEPAARAVAAYTGPAPSSTSITSALPPAGSASTANLPTQPASASGITVSTSTPVIVYNPINVSTPLEQTTVQQTGGSDGLGGGSVKDALLMAAALKPRVLVVPVFVGK